MEDLENSQHVLGYPECKNAKPIVETVDVPCPVCGGTVQVRKTKAKKNYYICENNKGVNQGCPYISWNAPKPGEVFDPNSVKTVEPKEKSETKKTTAKKTSSKTSSKASTKTSSTKTKKTTKKED